LFVGQRKTVICMLLAETEDDGGHTVQRARVTERKCVRKWR
jgi:hypothetical protein